MFSVLSDAAEIEKRLEWGSMKERIDEAREKGLRITDLRNVYDEVYRDEHDRIEEMIMKKQLVEAKLFFKTGQVLSIVEMETWSEEGCRIVVGWDPLVISANLLAQSDQAMHLSVRSLLDNKLLYVSVIYGEITPKSRSRLWRNLRNHVSIAGSEPWILLGDFNVILKSNENSNGLNVRSEGTQDFRECVDYLGVADINMNGLFYTCIQKMKNPELGVLKKLDKIMGNAQFIGPYPDSFAVFMPYLSSGQCPCVLILPELTTRKPRPFRFMNFLVDKKEFMISVRENWNVDVKGFAMFRLAKRIKFMKKHMRDLNRKNGDVFDKVNFLRTELGRIQECLDKDPSNVALREEEMVYASAFKDAALDEEKVVKGRVNRNRIKVVYDDKGNPCHRDEIANIFVSHFMSFLGTQDVVYEVEDVDSLFTKRLNADAALDLIKPVDDKEIKEDLFSIDDNKASGPDGYLSKFFKVV
ncbi:RNA-directed DNA polymerase, eukaryota, reverse transcriptase zinc-binding domain protein [Tanacetum coccineum]